MDEEACDSLDDDGDGQFDEDTYSAFLEPQGVVGVGNDPAPGALAVELVGPNPARHGVDFIIALPARDRIDVALHDLAGRRVATVLHQPMPAGKHPLHWRRPVALSDGMYVLSVTTADGAACARKIVFLR